MSGQHAPVFKGADRTVAAILAATVGLKLLPVVGLPMRHRACALDIAKAFAAATKNASDVQTPTAASRLPAEQLLPC